MFDLIMEGGRSVPGLYVIEKKCIFPAKVRRSLLAAEDGEAQNGKAAEAYNCRMPHESRLAMASQRLTSSLEVI